MVCKAFTTFPRKFDRGKVFFHCLKLGNMHADTRIVIELYDTGITKDSRRWVSLWPPTKKNAGFFVLAERSIVLQAALVQ